VERFDKRNNFQQYDNSSEERFTIKINRRRDKPMIWSPEGDEISCMLSCKSEEKLEDLVRDTN